MVGIVIGVETWKKVMIALVCSALLFSAVSAEAYSIADLAGTWYGNSLASGPGAPWWERATITITDNGSFSGSAQDSDGENDSLSGTLGITPDGIVTRQGDNSTQCRLDAGKTVIICTDTWTSKAPGSTEMKVFTKKGVSYSQADLTGDWTINSLASGPGAAPWWMRMTASIDASGVLSGAANFSDGTSKAISGVFNISSDGIITCTSGCGDPTLRCVLDAGKTVAACTATWTSGSPGATELSIMTKKSNSYSQSDLTGTWGVNSLASGPGAPWWARGNITFVADGAGTGTLWYSDEEPEDITSSFVMNDTGIVSTNFDSDNQCVMNASKTVVVCTNTWSHDSAGTTEMIVLTKQQTVPPKTLTSLVITTGPDSIVESSSGSYTTTAYWSDGTSSTITPIWSVSPATNASISNTGVLTALAVTSNQTASITASFTSGDVTLTANKVVTIVDTSAPQTFTINSVSNGNGSITCQSPVTSGSTSICTFTPVSGYAVTGIGGTCSGTPSGNTFTTGPINADCTVVATFSQVITNTVTASASSGGQITPGQQNVTAGATASFTITPVPGYHVVTVSGCNGGLSGMTYATGAVTNDCSVTAQFAKSDASFSEAAYLAANPDVAAAVRAGWLPSGWAHYSGSGKIEGRQLAPVGYGAFNEQAYLITNPDVAAAVKAGWLSSGWQHYNGSGKSEGRPLTPANYANYDENAYLAANPDVALAVKNGILGSGWRHYSEAGQNEGRPLSPANYGGFTEEGYLAANPDVGAAIRSGWLMSGWQHYNGSGKSEGRVVQPVGYTFFSETAYLAANPDVASAVKSGALSSSWQHYTASGKSEGRAQVPPEYANFSEHAYLAANPDVAAVVRSGGLSSGWAHYSASGKNEGRPLNPTAYGSFNESDYLAANPDIASAVISGALSSGWYHYVNWGKNEGRTLRCETTVLQTPHHSVITPANPAVTTGQTVQLSAALYDEYNQLIPQTANSDFTWTPSNRVNASGLFTAGDSAGQFTVTATLKSNPGIAGTTMISVTAAQSPIVYPNNGNCGNAILNGTWYESTGTAHTHFPAQIQFVNAGAGGYFYGYAAGALEYEFETDPTACGSIMISDGAQQLVISYGYTVSACELILTNWGKSYHYCRGGIGNCTSCGQ